MTKSETQQYTSHNQSDYGSYGSGNGSHANGGSSSSSLQTIGAILRERRESASVSLSDVEKATRIRQKYLAALEADEWHLLPGEVVGRGFLRNYTNYLRLNTNELMERRRAMMDGELARVLSTTSAGAALPPVRTIDYRPKDFDLEETPFSSRVSSYIAVGRDWFAPIVAIVAVLLVAFLVIWGTQELSDEVATLISGLQTRTTTLASQERPLFGIFSNPAENTPDVVEEPTSVAAAVNPTTDVETRLATAAEPDAAAGGAGGSDLGAGSSEPVGGTGGPDNAVLALEATATNTVEVPTPTNTPEPTATPEPPTPTPTLEPPTATPEPPAATPEPPTPTPEPPTPTPEPPTPTPEPAPVVQAANCPDGRATISSPGVNQAVSGVVPVTGSATHEQFNFYKLEFAPGANAEGGYVYFDGTAVPVQGGVLGNLDTTGLANGAYTIQLIVVDQTGNYPPPCRVTVNVQN